MKLIQILFATSLVTMSMSSCDTLNPLDIMFMVDSSGSVYDSEYNKWNAELDLVASIVDELPAQSRAGLINFSGCGPSSNLQSCIANNRLKLMIELDEFESSFNGAPIGLYDKVKSIGDDDFNGGYTWTNQALTIALDEFKSKSKPRDSTNLPNHVIPNRVIVLITDGEPYPNDIVTYPNAIENIPCDAVTGYISQTLTELRDELGVVIITVGIDINPQAKEEFFKCMTNSMDKYFFEGDFNTLPNLFNSISQLICDENTAIICEDNENMAWTECGTCDKTCDIPNPACPEICQRKCQCKSPTEVYAEGKCISLHQC